MGLESRFGMAAAGALVAMNAGCGAATPDVEVQGQYRPAASEVREKCDVTPEEADGVVLSQLSSEHIGDRLVKLRTNLVDANKDTTQCDDQYVACRMKPEPAIPACANEAKRRALTVIGDHKCDVKYVQCFEKQYPELTVVESKPNEQVLPNGGE